jgi:putative N6-adenine-specific DNA methylase
MRDYNIVVTTAAGVEGVTKKELRDLGISNPRAIEGSFHFEGNSLDIARLNMFLRTGERVYIEIAQFEAQSFDDLFENITAIDWENYLDIDGAFIVNGKSKKSALFALSSCQSIIKKAILTRLTQKTNTLIFSEEGATFFIEFSINNDIVTILLNTSGKGLHKRGYRDLVSEAPIKETLACALLLLSDMSADRTFIDPFCGSGTLVIEAARIALNIASGRDREFDYKLWKGFDKEVYSLAYQEALDNEKMDTKLRFSGFDIDSNAIKLSMHHAQRANISDKIHFQVQDVSKLSSRYKLGTIVTNPPYGERLLDIKQANALYNTLGNVYKSLDNWSLFAITSAPQFEKHFGKRSDKNRKFYNANKECHFYSYFQNQ